ncbi:MerR family transcriptional regulator [Clostridioides difficile]|nr:MerR family transcriptional regulator [Clostridioides difficile]
MKDYYKIGEISKIYGIGRDSLMYYEEIGILKPVRDVNGYRMYNISDIWKLNLIKEFRSLNFPMKKIKEYLDDRSIESTKSILNEELELIDKKMFELISHKENIIKRLSSIESVIQNTKIDEIEVVYIEKRKALELNADIKRDEDFDFLIQKLQKEYEDRFNILGNNNIGSAFSTEAISKGIFNEFKSVFCFLENSEEIYNIVFDEGYYVTLNYAGSNSNNKIYMEKVFKFIKENNYKVIAAPIEIYKIDIHETGIVEEFVTEIQVLVTKSLDFNELDDK